MRFIISNTTEAGIVYDDKDKLEDRPQSSFPGKLTAFYIIGTSHLMEIYQRV